MQELIEKLRGFVRERDWEQFHSPKNLSMALSVEASELLEIFQWLSESESENPDTATIGKIEDELADVLWYSLLLSDRLNIDLLEAANRKMLKNIDRYPADKVRGSASKYDKY